MRETKLSRRDMIPNLARNVRESRLGLLSSVQTEWSNQ